jgi:tryptophan 2,3-dioxygenase
LPRGARPSSPRRCPLSRLIENKLGLRATQRLSYGGRTGYCSVLSADDAATVAAAEAEPSLFALVEAWLERTPFLEWTGTAGRGGGGGDGGATSFSFWTHYRDAVEAMLAADEASLRGFASTHSPAALEGHARDLAAQRAHFESLLDPEKYASSMARGERRLSHRAMQAALFITLFQREPGLQLPYRLLSALLSTDEQLCAWRARHAQMVHRMLGAKLGTGGSSGYSYLKATVERHRIFTDLFNIATFLLPESAIPPLPAELRAKLGFAFSMVQTPRALASAPGSPQASPPPLRAAPPHPLPDGGGGNGGVCPVGFH